jgi:hypothetical protein
MSPMRYLVPLLAAAAGLGGGYALMDTVAPKSDTDTSSSRSGAINGPPPDLKGGDEQSMFRPEQLAKALGVVRSRNGGPGARLHYFRLGASNLNVTVDGDGKQTNFLLIPDGKVQYTDDTAGSSSFPEDDFAVGTVPAGAPWKIVRTLGSRSGISPDEVDYMVLEKFSGGRPQWLVYLKNIHNSYYLAALNGAHPTRK